MRIFFSLEFLHKRLEHSGVLQFQLIEPCATSSERAWWKKEIVSRSATKSHHCTKKRFPLRIFSVNVTNYAGNCGFGHIYLRNSQWKTSFFVQYIVSLIRKRNPNSTENVTLKSSLKLRLTGPAVVFVWRTF